MQPSQGAISDALLSHDAQGGRGDPAASLAAALAEAEQLRRGLARSKTRLKERERETAEAIRMQADTQRLLMEQIEDSRAVQVISSLWCVAEFSRFPAPPDTGCAPGSRLRRRNAGRRRERRWSLLKRASRLLSRTRRSRKPPPPPILWKRERGTIR